MKSKKLLIIGERKIVNIFKLLGADGRVMNDENQDEVIEYIEEKNDEIGGILLTESVYDPESKLVKRINASELPWVVLPSQKEEEIENSGYQELEKLAEKAIGMKLNF